MRSPLLAWLRDVKVVHAFEDDLTELAGLSAEELEELTNLTDDERDELAQLKDDDEDDDDDDPTGDKDVTKLKKALADERKLKKVAERKAKKLEREQARAANKDASELEVTKQQVTELTDTNSKLAAKLLTQAIDAEITKAARNLKFRDIDDALALIKRDQIEADQDEDDPSEIEIDVESVVNAVKAIATKKPHLLLADGAEDKSGSKFGGKKGNKAETTEEALKKKYPALNR